MKEFIACEHSTVGRSILVGAHYCLKGLASEDEQWFVQIKGYGFQWQWIISYLSITNY